MSSATWSLRERAVCSLAPAGLAAGQRGLDVHVDVFQLLLPLKPARGDFPGDLVKGAFDLEEFGFGEQADFMQHGRMGQGPEDILFPQTPIEGNGLGELRRVGGWRGGEPASAGNWRLLFHLAASMCGATRSKSREKGRESENPGGWRREGDSNPYSSPGFIGEN